MLEQSVQSQSCVHVSYNVVFISTKFSSDLKTIFVLLCTSLCWPIQPFQWTLQKWVSHHKMKHNEGCYTLDPWPAEPLVKLQQIVAEMARVRGKVHGYTSHASLPRTWHLTRNCYSLLNPLPCPRYPSFSTMHPAHTALIQRRNSSKKKQLKNIYFHNLHTFLFTMSISMKVMCRYLIQFSSSSVTMVSDSGRVWSVSDSGCDLSLMSIIDPVSSGSGREANTWYSYTVPNMPPAADAGSKDDRRKWRLAGIFLSQMMMGSKQPSKCSLTQNLSLVSFYLK